MILPPNYLMALISMTNAAKLIGIQIHIGMVKSS